MKKAATQAETCFRFDDLPQWCEERETERAVHVYVFSKIHKFFSYLLKSQLLGQ